MGTTKRPQRRRTESDVTLTNSLPPPNAEGKRRVSVSVIVMAAILACECFAIRFVSTPASGTILAAECRIDFDDRHARKRRFVSNELTQLSKTPLRFLAIVFDLAVVSSHFI